VQTKERSYRYGSNRYPSTYKYQNYPFTRYPGTSDDFQQRALKGYYHGGRFFFDPPFDAARYAIFDCSAWMDDYTADQVIVSASSTSNTTLTLASAGPSHFGVGSRILGTRVASGSGTAWVLAANADETITAATKKHFFPIVTASGTTNEKYSDWFIDQAVDYLKWHAIVSLNFKYNTYLARSETFQAPPEKARDSAKQSVIEWDSFMWEQGRQPMSIR